MNKKLVSVGIPLLIFLAVGLLIFKAGRIVQRTVGEDPHAEGVFLPGSQPNDLVSLDLPSRCRQCHAHDAETAPYGKWRGSMMAQATRDPLFYAALAIANQDIKGVGDFCLRCHTPQGWLLGRSEPPDGSQLFAADLDGVTCDTCHRMVDPFTDEGKSLVKTEPVPDYGNGMYVVSPEEAKRGPLADARPPHDSKYSPFHTKGEFCGTCHDVTNPVNNVPIERTFSEWEQSWFATQGEEGSCQACHMKAAAGYAAEPTSANPPPPRRDKVPTHDLTGGSNWIYDALPLLWKDVDVNELQAGKARAMNTLRQSADLELTYEKGDPIALKVKITNKTGHKLPTGYPEGRRMWINVKGFDGGGALVFESGKYDARAADLIEDDQVKIYIAKPAIKGKGPTFHFVLNNYIAKDNRIPPKGFTNAAFNKVGAGVVDYKYADGQNWDETKYALPANVAKVTVGLMYQSSEKSYIEFLANNNKTNDWGKKLVDVWEKTGRGAPVEIGTAQIDIE